MTMTRVRSWVAAVAAWKRRGASMLFSTTPAMAAPTPTNTLYPSVDTLCTCSSASVKMLPSCARDEAQLGKISPGSQILEPGGARSSF